MTSQRGPVRGRSARQARHGCEWQTNWPVPPMNTARSSRRSKPRSPPGADAAVGKIEEFGRWLQAVSLSAAGNGERAEEAAVANSVAVTAMPNVSEAVEERTARDVMDSLAAYNGAILNGRFAELDEAATGKQAEAAAIMYQYRSRVARSRYPGINRFLLMCAMVRLSSRNVTQRTSATAPTPVVPWWWGNGYLRQ